MKRRVISLAVAFLVPILILGGCQTAKKPAPQPNTGDTTKNTGAATLMELASRDPYNDGCVSCHKKTQEVDRSLPTYVKRIAGHPEVRESTVNACYNCHEAQKNYSLYKRFYQGLHKAHWESDIFYAKQKAQCFSCHTVEKNGVSGIKNYPLAGYRSGTVNTTPKAAPAPKADVKEEKKSEGTQQQENKQGQGTTQEKEGTDQDQLPTPTP